MAWRSRSMGAQPLVPLLAVPLAAFLLAACVDDSATPIDPAQPGATMDVDDMDFTGITHTMEPTPQMQEAAEAQCLGDPDLAEGYVRAVDPETETVLAEVTIRCEDVRG